ncbi:DedA family protein [Paenibacillus radicis (ex Xue et al. 2023)]|uniref:DedA family protein n=1 Tax=Paenibacillus radicis (ex Xue et al. 2023) TaxID=2972489 RepID=A0ABT1YPZ7_9BACL|nr:DedA family protein [Paenibacillus radicis (ex Xue et al. 2023)]MCR8635253.1 DedA family protein [Paenibacillus radicis (ex Xue et al. 2023)]
MNYDMLLSMIGQYGYAALFFALWLGIVGMPIPDEVIVMTGGAVTANGILQIIPAFIVTYLGVISGLSLGYVLGRFIGKPVIERLKRKKKMEKYLTASEKLIEKYGSFALVISYFLPVVRHVVPYVVGLNKMTFRRYALLSYSTGFVWTVIFFTVGRFFGDYVDEVGRLIHTQGLKWMWLPIVLLAIFVIVRIVRKNKNKTASFS